MNNSALEALKWGRFHSLLITNIEVYLYITVKLSLEIIIMVISSFDSINIYSLIVGFQSAGCALDCGVATIKQNLARPLLSRSL